MPCRRDEKYDGLSFNLFRTSQYEVFTHACDSVAAAVHALLPSSSPGATHNLNAMRPSSDNSMFHMEAFPIAIAECDTGGVGTGVASRCT